MRSPEGMRATHSRIVVCDNGTGYVKAGFAGDSFPRATFPCMVGRPVLRSETTLAKSGMEDLVVGAACAEQRENLEVSYPVSHGTVKDWESMYHIWDHTFQKALGFDPAQGENRIMLTNPPLNPTQNRMKLMETMFERYGFSGLSIQVQAGLTLYAQGLMTGLVLDSGDGVTHAVPVIDGFSFPNLTKRIDIAGRHVSSFLLELLQRRGYAFNRSADLETVRQLKEKASFVALNYQQELKIARETTHLVQTYALPDGRHIRVGAERFMAPEALFRPELIDKEGDGISDMVYNCIQENAMDNRMQLYSHIVLSGGCTMLSGLTERMSRDIRRLYLEKVLQGRKEGLKTFKLAVNAQPQRKHHVFLGASTLADIMKDDTDQFWVTKQDWEEDPNRALRKCDGLVAK